ncbi:hypothetical protein [Streptococcus marmotae]|uniref:hypothetical protein n=1 Tax=Streptococcus marmotae TaxID=1825069 RepID=UPI00083494DD|nr:hypothetical protein [Streptococcus marmotae]
MLNRKKVYSVIALAMITTTCFLPSVIAYANEIGDSSEIIALSQEELTSLKSQMANVNFNIISDQILEIQYPDGHAELLEQRPDGSYLNGEFFSEYTHLEHGSGFRYNPNVWNYVQTVRGNVL